MKGFKKADFLIMGLFIWLLFAFYLYSNQKKENLALRLKVKLLSQEKIKPLPWAPLLEKPNKKIELRGTKGQKKPQENTVQTNLESQSTQALATDLNRMLQDIQKQKLEEINDAIRVADEIIAREPMVFSAYKAKLILLLTKEASHAQAADDGEIERVLDEMAYFDLTDEEALRKEAFILSRTNSKINALEKGIRDREEELARLEEGEREEKGIDVKKELLFREIELQTAEVQKLEEELENGEMSTPDFLNEDLVEIPFQRALAHGEYDRVVEDSEDYIQAFPASLVGYYYLIRALELKGDEAAVLDAITNAELSDDTSKRLELRLKQSKGEDPKNYWKHLKF